MPQNINDMHSFLGLASYYKLFMCVFVDIATQLHRLMEKRPVFHRDQEVQEGNERVIVYYSQWFCNQECNYCVMQRKLLAVLVGLHQFQSYRYGVPFMLCTDHAPLIWLMKLKEPVGQVVRLITVY
ncbi:hypothetical protein MHYP_G00088310 [Metynnis hypsauchen]